MTAYSHNATRNFTASGVLMPLRWLTLIRDVNQLAEIKVIAAVYGYDGIVGIEADPPTFTDLVQRTGLSKPSVSQGVKAALDRGEITTKEDDTGKYYLPVYDPGAGAQAGKENSLPHDHVHEYLNRYSLFKLSLEKNHDHGEETLPRKHLYQILLSEFGFTTSQRVAADICLTPKYTVPNLYAQVRHVRFEQDNGEDGDPARPIRNAAGRLIYRLKRNIGPPKGFALLSALEAEGWTRAEIFEAVHSGEVNLPEIEQSFGFAAWLAGTG